MHPTPREGLKVQTERRMHEISRHNARLKKTGKPAPVPSSVRMLLLKILFPIVLILFMTGESIMSSFLLQHVYFTVFNLIFVIIIRKFHIIIPRHVLFHGNTDSAVKLHDTRL